MDPGEGSVGRLAPDLSIAVEVGHSARIVAMDSSSEVPAATYGVEKNLCRGDVLGNGSAAAASSSSWAEAPVFELCPRSVCVNASRHVGDMITDSCMGEEDGYGTAAAAVRSGAALMSGRAYAPVSETRMPGVRDNASKHFKGSGLGPASAASHGSGRPEKPNAWIKPPVVALPRKTDLGDFFMANGDMKADVAAVSANIRKFDSAAKGRLFRKRMPYFHLCNELKRRWENVGNASAHSGWSPLVRIVFYASLILWLRGIQY